MNHIRSRLAGFVFFSVASALTLGAAAQAQCTQANSVGFVGNGTTANDTAFSTWWAGLSSAGGCLEFGAGKYQVLLRHQCYDGERASVRDNSRVGF